MDLLGFGGENSFYLCSDTPAGLYDVAFQAIDGRGGKVELPLLIEVTEERVVGGQVEWFAQYPGLDGAQTNGSRGNDHNLHLLLENLASETAYFLSNPYASPVYGAGWEALAPNSLSTPIRVLDSDKLVHIDFEDLPVGTLVRDQYADRGLTIWMAGNHEAPGELVNAETGDKHAVYDFGGSLPNAFHVFGEKAVFTLHASDGTPAGTPYFKFRIGDGDSSPETFRITYLDINGNVLDTDEMTTQGGAFDGGATFVKQSIGAPMAQVEFEWVAESGFAIDDLTFVQPGLGQVVRAQDVFYGDASETEIELQFVREGAFDAALDYHFTVGNAAFDGAHFHGTVSWAAGERGTKSIVVPFAAVTAAETPSWMSLWIVEGHWGAEPVDDARNQFWSEGGQWIAHIRDLGNFNVHLESSDTDGDGTPDSLDLNVDNDGQIDGLDDDWDNDGVINGDDAFPYDPSESFDLDADGLGDIADTDDDGDGILDASDVFQRCPSNFCVVRDGHAYYFYNFGQGSEHFGFHHAARDLQGSYQGGLVGGKFEYRTTTGFKRFETTSVDGVSLSQEFMAAQLKELAATFAQSEGQVRLRPVGWMTNMVQFNRLGQLINLRLEAEPAIPVDEIVQTKAYARVSRPSEGCTHIGGVENNFAWNFRAALIPESDDSIFSNGLSVREVHNNICETLPVGMSTLKTAILDD